MIVATARREWGSLRRASSTSWVWLILSGLFLSGNWLFLYKAYQHIGVSLATLMCYCGPILIMILSYFVFHEPFTVPKITAMVIVTVGIVCINGADFQAHGLSWGLVCGFLSAVCFALLVVAAVTLSMQAILVPLDRTNIACMLCLGIVNTGLGYYLYFSGVQRLSAQSISICGYMEPFTALALSAILLGESLTVLQWLGAACILGGVALSELWHPCKKR